MIICSKLLSRTLWAGMAHQLVWYGMVSFAIFAGCLLSFRPNLVINFIIQCLFSECIRSFLTIPSHTIPYNRSRLRDRGLFALAVTRCVFPATFAICICEFTKIDRKKLAATLFSLLSLPPSLTYNPNRLPQPYSSFSFILTYLMA